MRCWRRARWVPSGVRCASRNLLHLDHQPRQHAMCFCPGFGWFAAPSRCVTRSRAQKAARRRSSILPPRRRRRRLPSRPSAPACAYPTRSMRPSSWRAKRGCASRWRPLSRSRRRRRRPSRRPRPPPRAPTPRLCCPSSATARLWYTWRTLTAASLSPSAASSSQRSTSARTGCCRRIRRRPTTYPTRISRRMCSRRRQPTGAFRSSITSNSGRCSRRRPFFR